ncbi:MAG: DUF3054 domain-containing protein [Nakamurella sp.]
MRPAVVVVVDLVCLLVFAAVGRGSHEEGWSFLGVFAVAWPFVTAAALGWVITRIWRAPAVFPSGVVIWACAWIGGQALRVSLTSHQLAWSFVLVSGIALAVLLLGWRLLVTLGVRRWSAADGGARSPSEL